MRISALPVLLCAVLGACASGRQTKESVYVKPNDLMSREIEERVAQIPFQQREELFNNLLWLAQTGEQAIPCLLEALEHDNAKVRSNTLWVLGRIRDRRTIPNMQALVTDTDPTVRFEAARTLVLLGDLQHVPVLVEGLDSNKRQVRYLCHQALAQATGRNFGYDHLDEDLMSRHHAAYRWRKWWSDQSGDPWFAKDYAKDHGLDMFEAENQWLGSTPAPMGETEQGGDQTQNQAEMPVQGVAPDGVQMPDTTGNNAGQNPDEAPETSANGWVQPAPDAAQPIPNDNPSTPVDTPPIVTPTNDAPTPVPPGSGLPTPLPQSGGTGTGDGR